MRAVLFVVLLGGAVALAAPAGAQETTTTLLPTTIETTTTQPTTTLPPSTETTPAPTTTTAAPTTSGPTTTVARSTSTSTTIVLVPSTVPGFVPPVGRPATSTTFDVNAGGTGGSTGLLPLLVVLSIGGFALALIIMGAQWVATRPPEENASGRPRIGRPRKRS